MICKDVENTFLCCSSSFTCKSHTKLVTVTNNKNMNIHKEAKKNLVHMQLWKGFHIPRVVPSDFSPEHRSWRALVHLLPPPRHSNYCALHLHPLHIPERFTPSSSRMSTVSFLQCFVCFAKILEGLECLHLRQRCAPGLGICKISLVCNDISIYRERNTYEI